MTITRQPVRIDTAGPDEEGCLFFHDARLVAVFVRLSEQHVSDIAGMWFLEHGFGPLDNLQHPIFDDLGAAEEWVTAMVRKPLDH